ncbi:hypothetical protein [Pseudomonas sp. AMR01]|uniref:hypothetical protein n=1 Tax=Pseudomonas sp. AMR01 TaxID=3064904 RepID=UPI0035C1BAE1
MAIAPRFAHLYDSDLPADIAVGLVLHLDPPVLESEGGTYTCNPTVRVQDQHFFVCIAVNTNTSRWLPLYTEPGEGRTNIASTRKHGHKKWTEGPTYWHKDQVWEATSHAVYLAAGRAHDKSRKGSRNYIDPSALPTSL